MGERATRAERRGAQEEARRQKALARLTDKACQILLMRHGETDWNVDHRLQGQMHPGPHLNSRGLDQAQALAAHLSSHHLDAIYSSDLHRTLQTANLVQEHHQNLKINTDPDLRERYLACLQGLTIDEGRATHPKVSLGLLKPNKEANEAGVESLDNMQRRVAGCLERIARAHPGQTVLAIAHGGVLHVVHRKAMDSNPPAKAYNCAINVLKIDASKQPAVWALEKWGDDGHLDDKTEDSFGGGAVG